MLLEVPYIGKSSFHVTANVLLEFCTNGARFAILLFVLYYFYLFLFWYKPVFHTGFPKYVLIYFLHCKGFNQRGLACDELNLKTTQKLCYTCYIDKVFSPVCVLICPLKCADCLNALSHN